MADTSILENRLVYIGQEKDDPKLVVEKNHACACQKSEPEVTGNVEVTCFGMGSR